MIRLNGKMGDIVKADQPTKIGYKENQLYSLIIGITIVPKSTRTETPLVVCGWFSNANADGTIKYLCSS